MNVPKKKLMPFTVTKSKLLEMYGDQMSDKFIRSEINIIINEKRDLPTHESPRLSKVIHL